MKDSFDEKRNILDRQYENIAWLEDSGCAFDELKSNCEKLEEELSGKSHTIIKARVFEYILSYGQLALDLDDIFSEKLNGRGIILRQRDRWFVDVYEGPFKSEYKNMIPAFEAGVWYATPDFGHTSPNSKTLIEIGFKGLLDRINTARAKKPGLTAEQEDFYTSCEIMVNAVITYIRRMAEAIRPYDEERYICLSHLAEGSPQNMYEALQLLVIYFFMHEYIGGTRVRTLGRLDLLLYPFYKNDIANNTYTKAEIKVQLKYFLNKFWSAKVPFDLPFMLGGKDEKGNEITNELSYLIVEAYDELNIYSPKIHIGVSDKTPESFVKKVLGCIRGGNSSFLFVNEAVAVKALEKAGITPEDAREFVLIGCYEPAVWGKEIGCTGNGSVNLAKAVEFVFTGGRDFKTGKLFGLETALPDSFEEFLSLVKKQLEYTIDKATEYVKKLEKFYYYMNPDPILSSMYDACVENGTDAYNYGAKYNNSSINFTGIASLVDSIMAVKRLVYDEKAVSFAELKEILESNWEKNKALQGAAKRLSCKYGNMEREADLLTKGLTEYIAALTNNRKNSRGGVFKAGLFSIDRCFTYGAATMATPDGRLAGEPLSKNLGAVSAMDKNGITALINSVTGVDHSDFPNGSVLDVVLHPTAVSGSEGLEAMYALLKTYFLRGGFAMHGNVFSSEILKKAQSEPEKYSTLQVRLCGWNVYFVDLTKEEQDDFIKKTENF